MIKKSSAVYYLPTLAISFIFLISIMMIRNLLGNNWFAADNEIVVNYLQVISAIYAIIVGFVLYVVWNQFVEMEKTIGKEAGQLQAIRRLSSLIGDDEEQAVRWAVSDYIQETVKNGEEEEEAWKKLYLTTNIGKQNLNEMQRLAFSDILDKLEQVIEYRNERIAIEKSKIPWPLWLILGIVTISLLVPFCLLSVESLGIHLFLTESSVISSIFILSLIFDLNHPTAGTFNVSFMEMEKLLPDAHLRKRKI